MKKHYVVILLATLVVSAGIWGVKHYLSEYDLRFTPVLEREATIPVDARIVKEPQGGIRGILGKWEWEFEISDWNWERYQKWIERKLTGYHLVKRSEKGLTFTKTTNGDIFYLFVDQLETNPLRVKVILNAGPN